MKLEDQLSVLAESGLPLSAGRTVAELLYSFPREAYEREPFSLVLFTLGIEVESEPWGRWFCDRAWNFDTECVHGPGAYVKIARQLSRIAGRPDALADLRDHVDLDIGEAWIEYAVGDRRRRWDIQVSDDWADLTVVSHLMAELEHDGRRFHSMENGQSMVLFFLDDVTAGRLNEIAGERQVVAVQTELVAGW
ncbi:MULTISPECIES: hypothetical protein [Thermomonosporaceae]|uniref:hypothetical protein n=1 Tax=Thermomonosporaceae TaxID=2012 RepID=UPI00255AC5DB|nr:MULTISPECIES: hypothetical protein [Thermomonosporaceae]MDL4772054.1 hypothetical protein [Actinomadura xylanilytica]